MTGRLSGGDLVTHAHRYPGTPGDDQFLGILVHYDENHEVVGTGHFTVTG